MLTTIEPIAPVSGPALVDAIAAQLGETEELPKRQIARAVRVLGEQRVQELVAETLAIEDAGGLMLPDGSRKRTRGGVFFRLIRERAGKRERYRIFRPQERPGQQQAQGGRRTAAPSPGRVTWEEIAAELPALFADAQTTGKEAKVKLTAIGRPSKVHEQGDVVTFALRSTQAPSLPKGMPTPIQPATNYAVVASAKQYRRVAEALAADAEERVIVEGYPSLVPGMNGIAVHATSISTVGQQRARREAQAAAAPA